MWQSYIAVLLSWACSVISTAATSGKVNSVSPSTLQSTGSRWHDSASSIVRCQAGSLFQAGTSSGGDLNGSTPVLGAPAIGYVARLDTQALATGRGKGALNWQSKVECSHNATSASVTGDNTTKKLFHDLVISKLHMQPRELSLTHT